MNTISPELNASLTDLIAGAQKHYQTDIGRIVTETERREEEMKYSVIVGNIGTVCETDSLETAHSVFNEYTEQSQSDYGRAAGEDVSLLEDGEPIEELIGSLSSDEELSI